MRRAFFRGITVVCRPSDHFGQRLALAWFRPLEVGWHKGVAEQAHDVDTLSVLRDAMICGVYDCVTACLSSVPEAAIPSVYGRTWPDVVSLGPSQFPAGRRGAFCFFFSAADVETV